METAEKEAKSRTEKGGIWDRSNMSAAMMVGDSELVGGRLSRESKSKTVSSTCPVLMAAARVLDAGCHVKLKCFVWAKAE